MEETMKEFIKKIAFRYTNFGAPSYPYNIEPMQLAEIVTSINTLHKLREKLNIFEIGVARGMTSRFIVQHIIKSNIKADFYCIDTFNSFTDEDMEFEVSRRGKSLKDLKKFAYNDFDAWRRNFSKYDFVKPMQFDAAKFDFSTIPGGVDFVFLDVDLYQPTIKVLRNVIDHLNDGAIILVDDVKDNGKWDGAFEAFFEFVKETNIDHEVIGGKCGKISWKAKV
jgi:O-methyltransferase